MMKSYLNLISISAKVHKKQSIMTIACIILAVFLVTTIFSMADMELRSQKIRAVSAYGEWHIQLKNISERDAELISSRTDVAASSWYNVLNYRLNDNYYIGGKKAAVCGIEKPLLDIMAYDIVEGEYPKNNNQVVLTKNAKDILGVELGDNIVLDNPSGIPINFTISGFGMDNAMMSKADAFAAFMTKDAFKHLYETASDKEIVDSDFVYYVQFSKKCNIRKAIQNLKEQYSFTDENISENTALLGVMGFSGNSYMMGLYLVAGVMFLIVLTAGVLMIASSLNSNIAQRTKFFGMLRCIGASKKQIIYFVRLEALNWCKTAIPIGIGAGIVIVWVLCAILRYLSESYFSDMPMFGFSGIGIVSGLVVGILTVLIATQSPAKKAAAVSPLTAVLGNAVSIQNIKREANSRMCNIDTALGIHHAVMNKRNFILMVSSFALSVVLFLSFFTLVNFMHHAITPLRPYTPDISVVSKDKSCSVDSNLIGELQKNPNVRRVYGRMFAYNVPVKFNGQSKSINLISYDICQFNWAEDSLLEGEMNGILDNENLALTVYNDENPLKPGDKIELSKGELTVAGVLADCPFDREYGIETVICSENTFRRLTGEIDYTIIDIQLSKKITDEDVSAIRDLVGDGVIFADQRLSNKEAKGVYWSFVLFIYGFLCIIAMISVFNIINSISMSVYARVRQYGIMRAIGMDYGQMVKMIIAEALTYGLTGSAVGCIVGLPIHKFLFESLVTNRWGEQWQVPFGVMILIVLLVIISSFTAVYSPSKRICNMSIINIVNFQ